MAYSYIGVGRAHTFTLTGASGTITVGKIGSWSTSGGASVQLEKSSGNPQSSHYIDDISDTLTIESTDFTALSSIKQGLAYTSASFIALPIIVGNADGNPGSIGYASTTKQFQWSVSGTVICESLSSNNGGGGSGSWSATFKSVKNPDESMSVCTCGLVNRTV